MKSSLVVVTIIALLSSVEGCEEKIYPTPIV